MLSPAAMALAATAPAGLPRDVPAALADSAAGWNANDLPRFMAIYAPDAVFVTKAGLVRGREAIAARYRASFAGRRNRRGALSFTVLATRPIDAGHVLVFARYHLQATPGEDGPTTLLFARRREGWRIVADHSGWDDAVTSVYGPPFTSTAVGKRLRAVTSRVSRLRSKPTRLSDRGALISTAKPPPWPAPWTAEAPRSAATRRRPRRG